MSGRANQPLVSVIVPSYNKPEYLPECLRSIQAQTFRDWECIVVSDGSPDEASIRAAVEAMSDRRFKLIECKDNQGPSVARNLGACSCSGAYVTFVDGDDAVEPDFLLTMIEVLRREGPGHFAACSLQRVGERSETILVRTATAADIVAHGSLTPAGGLVFLRRDFMKAGMFCEHRALRSGMEDLELWLRAIIRHGLRPVIVDKPLYIWRATGDSRTHFLIREAPTIRKWLATQYPEVFVEYREYCQFMARGYQKKFRVCLNEGENLTAFASAVTLLWYEGHYMGCRAAIRRFVSSLYRLAEIQCRKFLPCRRARQLEKAALHSKKDP